ncbi:MAG: hypothetical protein WCK05_07670 [Planctomycetota bacterium]
MPDKIRIRPGQPVGLHLTVDDRAALLEMGVLDETLAPTIQQASVSDQNVMLTMAELSALSRNVAAGTGRTRDNRSEYSTPAIDDSRATGYDGSLFTDALRPVDQAKIDCCREHFRALGTEVRFKIANTYDTFTEQLHQ